MEASLKAQRAEEACRAAEAELATARHQLGQQQGSRRARDKEVERLSKALDLLRGAEHEVTARLLQVEGVRATGGGGWA